jgi:hypothetical protein
MLACDLTLVIKRAFKESRRRSSLDDSKIIHEERCAHDGYSPRPGRKARGDDSITQAGRMNRTTMMMMMMIVVVCLGLIGSID